MTPFYPLTMILFTAALMLPHVAAATNSTIIPRPAGDGHHPGRQLVGDRSFSGVSNFWNRHGEISGQRYQIGSQIGYGGGGIVYEATHEGKPVAIKLMSNPITAEKKIGFLKKLRGSKNVVEIRNSEVKSTSMAIVLELCAMDLEKWMDKNVLKNIGLSRERVISEFVPFFSSAIQQMHVNGIVHKDLKPKKHFAMWKCLKSD